jgi:ssDNA-binding Zn-finger/Zn-ribbon topoisomerase 1
MIREMEQMGIVILPFKGQIHRKLAIIDREILWEGSLNILSQRDSKEVMRRFVGKETAKQMINFLRLDKNIGKIGENNILRCEYCNKPGSWYWTDRSMYGIWTFCLTGMHKRGAPPKTQKEIKERKKGLTNMRKSEKKKTEDGIPICQNRKVHEEDIPMIKREGRFGEFWGCPKYPRCKNVAKL